ncbi:MAG: bifunctional aspartate kinase/homoserine dehydrogenase I [Calditrichia bacterium]
MKILKFGGTSVGSSERIEVLLEIVSAEYQHDRNVVVVSSAFSGVTNKLVEIGEMAAEGNSDYLQLISALREMHLQVCEELKIGENTAIMATLDEWFANLTDMAHGVFLVRELSPRLRDFITSFGERFSCLIISRALQRINVPAEYADARELIRTDDQFGAAQVDREITDRQIVAYLKDNNSLPIVTGFIASTAKGETTTIGRGGSDYTAAIFGAALSANEVQIWTDVDGVMTADPRKVRGAFSLPAITYEEAMEMSHFGAKVIYPPTIQPLLNKNIPIRIMNSFNRSFAGTLISASTVNSNDLMRGISSVSKIGLILLQGSGMVGVTGIAGRLFSSLARHKINILLISQACSEHSICLAIAPEHVTEAKSAIETEFHYEMSAGRIDPPQIEDSGAIVSVVGDNMRHLPGISAEIFNALGREKVNVKAIAQGSSERNISIVIDSADETTALNCIHNAFFEPKQTLNLFMVGVGLIGRELLSQIAEQQNSEEPEQAIRVVGLANSQKMCLGTVDLSRWEDQLKNSSEESSLKAFVQEILALNLPNSIFVDCTGSDITPPYYHPLLKNGISVVTPNKKACSASYAMYRELQDAARQDACFFYETNVGAGLPIIRTLNDLKRTGDPVKKIEGVLSGTLSYIFNNFTAGTTFSACVEIAQKQGFTEPDPREDLNGMDVARKILILARESGVELEPDDVKVENLVPKSCRSAETIDAFFTALKQEDGSFEERRAAAEKNGERLRYIATLENGRVQVGLRAVNAEHPFYSLEGSDNKISFTTRRYNDRPLVISGPGAGAAVTASGVFADILRVADERIGN